MNKLLQKTRCKKGLAQLPMFLIGVLILFMAISVIMEVYPVFVAKSKIHDVATEMVRFVELRGQTGAEAEAEFKRFCDVTNLKNAHMKIEGEFMRDGVRLQLQSPFTITIEAKIPAAGLTLTLTARATGRSQMYWKN